MLRSRLAFAFLFSASTLAAQADGLVTVVHGIPGLPKAVDVLADGRKLFSFDYGDSRGPLSLAPKTYKLEVKLDNRTVLSLDATVESGKNYTIVAHLKEKTGIALSAFVDDTANLRSGKARLYVRHLADAPAVDVLSRRWWWTTRLFRDVGNGQEGMVDVWAGTYEVSLNAAGTNTRAFGPARLTLERDKVYAVHAIGKLGDPSFRLFVQTIDPARGPAPKLVGQVRGTACGGAIAISTDKPEFDKAFDLTLTGGTPDGLGILHSGLSDSRFLVFRLPLDLGAFGANGCFLYQDTQVLTPVRLDAKGGAKVSRTIPSGWSSWFREVHYQYSFVAPGKNRLGLLLTQYATVERDD